MSARPALLVAAALLGSALLAEAAPAAPPEPRVHGPACPPTGCPAAPTSPLSSAAGFATAAATVLLLSRRPRAGRAR